MSGLRVVETLQKRLKSLGYYTGEVDDIAGPLTEAAVVAFKAAHGYWPRPYVGPITIALLFSQVAKPKKALAGTEVPPWYAIGLEREGLHERDDNAELRAFLRADGATLGDPKQFAWCGDFVDTCIRLALPDEETPDNPYLARNWLKWGQPCDEVFGAVCVFWRGSPKSIFGHVGFVAGSDDTAVHVLGGNQSNSISITRIARTRLLGCRWPKTYRMTGERMVRDATGDLSLNEA